MLSYSVDTGLILGLDKLKGFSCANIMARHFTGVGDYLSATVLAYRPVCSVKSRLEIGSRFVPHRTNQKLVNPFRHYKNNNPCRTRPGFPNSSRHTIACISSACLPRYRYF